MSHHPCYAMALVSTAIGIAGYSRIRSVPSLVAGAIYGTTAYIIKGNKCYGHEAALAASVVLTGSMVPKTIKARKPFPVTLVILSTATGIYYTKKTIEY